MTILGLFEWYRANIKAKVRAPSASDIIGFEQRCTDRLIAGTQPSIANADEEETGNGY